MTVEILQTIIETDLDTQVSSRAVIIIITNAGQSFMMPVGNLPLSGDLQAALDAREAELWAAAQASGRIANLYTVAPERVIKAVGLVILDEINILRQRAGLAQRSAAQIDDAIKTKLKGI